MTYKELKALIVKMQPEMVAQIPKGVVYMLVLHTVGDEASTVIASNVPPEHIGNALRMAADDAEDDNRQVFGADVVDE